MKLIPFLIPALMLGQGINVTPLNPVVNEGGSVKITADRSVTFSLSGIGSLTPVSGKTVIFAAPPTVQAQHVLNGCMVLPADSVFNTPIANLPVNANSDQWVPYISDVGFTVEYVWGTNVIDNSVPASPQTFHYSTQYNGALFQIPSPAARKRETGSFSSDGYNDHHLLSLNRQTCQFYETYQDSVPIPDCPSCTAASGWTYQSTGYHQPSNTDGGGTTDAAGLPLAPLTLHLSEIKAGVVNHALRFTTCVACIGQTALWPAITSTGVQPGAPPMGTRFRLKSAFDTTAFPPAAQTVLTALKQYGMFLSDVGMEGRITASTDLTEDPEVVSELKSIEHMLTYTDFEAVDESSFILSPGSNQVNPANPFEHPVNSAILTVIDASNPANQVTIPIAIRPAMVGTPDPVMTVQAGTNSFQIPYWVNGSSNRSVTWSLSPSRGAGSISARGVYTAPAAVASLTKAILTITSVADPNASTSIALTIIPAGPILIDSGSQTGSVDESGNVWLPDLGFETASFNTVHDDYPSTAWGPIPSASVWQTYMYTWGDDIIYRLHVPNGNYKIGLMMGIGGCDGAYSTATFDNGLINGPVHLQGQAQIAAHNYDFGIAINHQCRTPSTAVIPAKVTDTNLLIAIRATTNDAGHSAPTLNGLTITPDTSAPHISIDTQQQQTVNPGAQLQLYMVDWYTRDASASWSVVQGPGTISPSGLFTAPADLQTGECVTVQAVGKSSRSSATAQFYIPVNGAPAVIPQLDAASEQPASPELLFPAKKGGPAFRALSSDTR